MLTVREQRKLSFQGSSTPASLSIFSIISAIRFSMINLIREVLRGENQVGISRIRNIRFPEMHNFSFLLVSMISSVYMPLAFDSGDLQNPKHSIEIPIPSEKVHANGIISAYKGAGSSSHVLSSTTISAVEKSGSCKVGLGIIISSLANSAVEKLASCKVGLGIIINSPAEEAEPFDNKVKRDFPKLLGSSVEINVTSENKVDHAPISPSSFHEPFHSSPVNLTIPSGRHYYLDVPNEMTNISGQDVTIPSGRHYYVHREWPCVFAVNQSFDSVTRSPLFTNSTGFLDSEPQTICIKHRNAGFLTLEEIENTDNYTRRTNYLPYPKVTHMYNTCILEFPPKQSNFNKKKPGYPLRVHNSRRWSLLSTNENFLKNCETCNKSLDGNDIYIYRGESSFCSLECRYWKVKAERDFARLTKLLITIPPSSCNKKIIFYYGAKTVGA